MKRIFSNMTFTISFIVISTIVVRFYFSDFAEALASEPDFFPPDEVLPIASCQEWTENVRNFDVTDEEKAEQITVLMYHRIIDDEDIEEFHFDDNGNLFSTILVKSEFEKQMDLLLEHDYTTLTSLELQLFLMGQLDVPKNSIVLTFDDGFKDNYNEAYPILKEHGFTALNFMITSAISLNDRKYKANEFQYLSVSDIESSCDVFEFQSHTYNFHQRTFNQAAFMEFKPREEILEDLEKSITNLANQNRSFAYPYGAYKDESIEILEEAGFEMAFTVEYRDAVPGDSLYEIPRKEVYSDTTLDVFKEKINLKD
ncbi:polysaccharide deacetylase family protein [Evansella tamaricis]|uniref:Polysaccharide deacetylase family protein n=1 Tax=Evansella tamaricis TaxID=2069301 RepID=A0ABS6JFE0_9BACI|nr:polysaccharide deacetylase family protein [Evansella tamaricis]MBU9711532.1 polysaccharide deacetylase family protein [Evansella tamaricis]